jgi:spermidine/putrescine transport system substrate-binding protein
MSNDLNILTWPDYIHPETLKGFEAKTGAVVHLEIVPSAVELVERMRAQGAPPDILCPPDYAVRELGAENRLHELDQSRLPGLANLEPRFRSGRKHDPEGRISIVKDWGTTGFMHRQDRVMEPAQTWEDFWLLAEKYSGKVTVLDSPGEVIGAALKMRGHSYNAFDPAALDQAKADLLNLRPHLHSFETNYRPLLTSGEVVLALGWNGDASALKAAGIPIHYVVPEEGSQIWEDDWAIAAGAPNLDLAYAFLEYVLDPAIAAQEARYTGYATGNHVAFDLLPAEVKNDPSTYPAAGVLGKLESGMPLGAEGDQRRAALWEAVRKSGA